MNTLTSADNTDRQNHTNHKAEALKNTLPSTSTDNTDKVNSTFLAEHTAKTNKNIPSSLPENFQKFKMNLPPIEWNHVSVPKTLGYDNVAKTLNKPLSSLATGSENSTKSLSSEDRNIVQKANDKPLSSLATDTESSTNSPSSGDGSIVENANKSVASLAANAGNSKDKSAPSLDENLHKSLGNKSISALMQRNGAIHNEEVKKPGQTVSEFAQGLSRSINGRHLIVPLTSLLRMNTDMNGLTRDTVLVEKTSVKVLYMYDNTASKDTFTVLAKAFDVNLKKLLKANDKHFKSVDAHNHKIVDELPVPEEVIIPSDIKMDLVCGGTI
jgi:hypothetical protein